jgi:hypothetical protein
MKMKLFLILTHILFTSILASNSHAREEPPNLQALSDSFRGKLSNRGSFQAIYSLKGKEKELYISVTVNRERHFLIASLEEQPTPSFEKMFLVIDYQPERKSFNSFAYANNKAIRYDVFPDGLTSSLNNPLGVLAFLSEQASLEVGQGATKREIKPITSAPRIELRLSKTEFHLHLGCQFDTDQLSASWTDVSMLTNSSSIEERSNAVVINLQDGHSISVSPETGLLIKDDFPNSESQGERYIKLHSVQEFDSDRTIEQLIPQFPLLVFEKIPATTFEQAFTLSFLESLGKQIALGDNFDSLLEENKQKIQETILPMIRKQIHQSVMDDLDPSFTEKMKNDVIMPYYQNHLQKNPGTSFNEFLDLMMYEVKKDPKAIIPSEALEFTRELTIQSKKMLRQLSEESREPISKLMDISVPVVIDAFILEFLEQTINGMRTSGSTLL